MSTGGEHKLFFQRCLMRSETLFYQVFLLLHVSTGASVSPMIPAKPNMLTQKHYESLLIRLRSEIMLWEIVPVASEVPLAHVRHSR